ncbi:MAG: hypothetical protein LBV75_07940 [Paludibacter sp.]|nr:hypothetical protein [Paludibacter sp.]
MKNPATWIWYPGDFEIWLANRMQCRRSERGAFFPPFWKMDSHYVLVEFSKQFDLQHDETFLLQVEGQYNVKIDGKMCCGYPTEIPLSAGKHSVNIKVYNQTNVPAIFVNGETVKSNETWLVTCEDKEWIDESGKASDTSSGTEYQKVGTWNFNSPNSLPSEFKLATEQATTLSSEKLNSGILYDFGHETFGFLSFHSIAGNGRLSI